MEGLWTAEFGSGTGMFGSGVAVFREGKIFGGDSTYYYIGEYSLRGNTFEATLKIFPFIEGAESVFRTRGQALTLTLVGTVTGKGQATAQGYPEGMPQLKFGARLIRRG